MEAGGSSSRKRKSAVLDPDEAARAAVAAEGHGAEPAAENQEGGAANDRISHLPDGVLGDGTSLLPTTEGPRASKTGKSAGFDSLEAAAAAAEGHGPEPAAEGQEPPLPVARVGAVKDRISHLPDCVLGEIISHLPTRQGARTALLARLWRKLWRSAPLNLDYHGLCQDVKDLGPVMSSILSAHQGPARRFCAPVYHHHGGRTTTADAWLRSPALRNLQELELCHFQDGVSYEFRKRLPSPMAAFRFSETLCVATIGDCQVPDIGAPIQFPKLKKLGLEHVRISESSLNTILRGCVALKSLLIAHCHGFRRAQISSFSLRTICVKAYYPFDDVIRFEELIIQNAPCLERLLRLISGLHTSVIFAPKLETVGCISCDARDRLVLDSIAIQGLLVDSLTSVMHTVKILDVSIDALSLDTVINLMRCFPCLERLYIKSCGYGKNNLWKKKHRDFISSFDIRLKKITWQIYRGTKSHVDFAMFFVLNARALKLMTFQVMSDHYTDEEFYAQQHKELRLESKASGGAQFHFTPVTSHRSSMDFRVPDLDLADPFQRRDHSEFRALS